MNKPITITLKPSDRDNKPVITINFPYNREIAELLKSNGPSYKWSQRLRCWYVPKEQFNLHQFFEIFKGEAWVDYSALKVNTGTISNPDVKNRDYSYRASAVLPKGYLEKLEQKRYSPSTQKTYIAYFKDFCHYFTEYQLENISVENINQYILSLILKEKISASEQNQRINAIKFYYEKVLGREKQYFSIDRPKKISTLPKVLSKAEVQQILEHTSNIKHRCILALIYSAGLRRSELINLKITDIISEREQIHIVGAKGNKDRYSLLSLKLLNELREYYKQFKPQYWLFEGPPRETI